MEVIKSIKGSMTIEATLVFPVFLYAIFIFLYFIQILNIQEIISKAIIEEGNYISRYAAVYEDIIQTNNSNEVQDGEAQLNQNQLNETQEGKVQNSETQQVNIQQTEIQKNEEENGNNMLSKIITTTFLKQKLKDYLEIEYIDKSCIVNGYEGISLYESNYDGDSNIINITAKYKVRFPILFFSIGDKEIVQKVRLKAWTGYTGANDKGNTQTEDIVYITQTGTVYHTSKDCSHLSLSISLVAFNDIEYLRNLSGGKYKSCELCVKNNVIESSAVYIAKTGDRYHIVLNCSGLKRYITSVPISKIGNKKLCERCSK